MDSAGFAADIKTQDAVIRNLEVIGEACNNVRRVAPELKTAVTRLLTDLSSHE
jgi:uncharacterized protein with HEPN domain